MGQASQPIQVSCCNPSAMFHQNTRRSCAAENHSVKTLSASSHEAAQGQISSRSSVTPSRIVVCHWHPWASEMVPVQVSVWISNTQLAASQPNPQEQRGYTVTVT